MPIKHTTEHTLEQQFINTLISGDSQWSYAPEIKSEQALWDNFFDILHTNNLNYLADHPLTEDEKSQIRTLLDFPTFFDAGQWLSGENGIAQVQIQRTDASLGIVNLKVHDSTNIAGGMSVYQVVHQIKREKTKPSDRNRRTDVTLLINGLPLIHIELKNRGHGTNEAFEQIKKYDAEKKFSGIFSLVQAFVISNGSVTKYIAADKHYKLDANYLNTWVNDKNEAVHDLFSFAKDVLSIPMAHELVTNYTVLDATKKSLLVMRPYQIHATKTILDALEKEESGYIWHTTGSGKTLTSYKTSKTILRKRRSLNKVLFLVDRKDLDDQTTGAFEAYAKNDSIQVDGTDNVNGLIQSLLSPKRELVVTTAQKLNHLIKRFDKDTLSKQQKKQKEQLKTIKLAFVVDEAHRAVSSEQQRIIDRFFKQPVKLWYGFTGTPIFDENRKQVKGDLVGTTPEQYGRELHRYTIKEAIYDETVLPFQVEYLETVSEDAVDEFLTDGLGIKDEAVEKMTIMQKEDALTEDVYLQEEHMLAVIDQIVNRSASKLGLGKGSGQTYMGILTVPSIKQAQAYYQFLKQVKEGKSTLSVSRKVKKSVQDFPKVALTYSISENEESSLDNQRLLSEAIADYNNLFNTNHSLETANTYNKELTKRLARKEEQYHVRDAQLDLVIVVDRMLTGFDAPAVSTLFIDRPSMPPHSLIQAFSRTNRLHGEKGAHIVTFRTPETYKSSVRNAVRLYSAGSEPEEVMAPTWKQAEHALKHASKVIDKVVNSVDDLLHPSTSDEKRIQFAKAFQELDKAHGDIQVYYEFSEESDKNAHYLEDTFGLTHALLEHYHALYNEVIALLRESSDDGDGLTEFDIEYQLMSRYREEIDYKYILSLMDRHQDKELNRNEEKEIEQYIEDIRKANPTLGSLLIKVWFAIKTGQEDVKYERAIDVLERYKEQYIADVIQSLAVQWRVQYNDMRYFVQQFNPNKPEQTGWSNLADKIWECYDRDHDYALDDTRSISKLSVKRVAKDCIFETLEREVVPLRLR